MNHRRLLIKYINWVGQEEGSTFLNHRQGWLSDVEFTDEEWATLKELEAIDYEALSHHSCSCHMKNAGPCDICKVLGCEVWDFNQVAIDVPEVPQPLELEEVEHDHFPPGGIMVDGMYVPPHGLFGIRNFGEKIWGKRKEESDVAKEDPSDPDS